MFLKKQDKLQFTLPKKYKGAFKILGKNMKVKADAGRDTLIIGTSNKIKYDCYIEPNLRYANKDTNFIIYSIEPDVERIKALLPEYTVFTLEVSNHPIDYFSLIRDSNEMERFASLLIDSYMFLNKNSDSFIIRDNYMKECAKRILLCAMDVELKAMNVENSSYDHVKNNMELIEKFADNPWDKHIAREFPLYEMKPQRNTMNVAQVENIVEKLGTEENVAVVIAGQQSADLYSSIFVAQFIEQYIIQFYDRNTKFVRLLLNNAETCFYDMKMFAVLTKTVGLSIDFMYSHIKDIKNLYPHSCEDIMTNVRDILLYDDEPHETAKFASMIGKLPKTIPTGYELVLELPDKWYVVPRANANNI